MSIALPHSLPKLPRGTPHRLAAGRAAWALDLVLNGLRGASGCHPPDKISLVVVAATALRVATVVLGLTAADASAGSGIVATAMSIVTAGGICRLALPLRSARGSAFVRKCRARKGAERENGDCRHKKLLHGVSPN